MQLSKKELGTFLDPDYPKKKLCKSICGRDVRTFFGSKLRSQYQCELDHEKGHEVTSPESVL
jgi:hypothetical protein